MSSRRSTRDSVTTTPTLPQAAPSATNARAGSGPTIAASAKTMLATASHEIRAPLHTILGMSELLTRTTLTPAQAQYLDALRRAATSLTSLLDSLIDNHRQRDEAVRHERVWLPDVVEAAVATVRDRAAVAGLDLVVDVDNTVPRRVLGDGVRLQQVLINLLVNAVKYGERGTVTLRVRRDIELVGSANGSISDDAVGIVFDVEDTGPGIPAAKLKEIFVSGARLERHANVEGSGLGLAITRRIVEDLGGRLEVTSRHVSELGVDPGSDQRSGTIFRVRLPLARASSVETVDGTALAIRGVRFLVVGDDILAAQVRSALAPWSPFIDRVDARDAKTRWQSHDGTAPFHVLIVAGEYLDAVDGIAEGRVITVLSAAALGQCGNAIERVGATPILLPVTTGNLFGAVERVLRRVHNLDQGSRDIELHGAVVHAADDDPDARLLIELFLKDTGVQLHLHSTTQGLINAVAADERTTLVLCDVEMPDGGARVARAAIPLRDGVTIVAVTAHGDAVIDDLHAEGFVEVARKPLTRRGLIDVIARRGVPRLRRASSIASASSAASAASAVIVGSSVPGPTGTEPTIVLSPSMQKQPPVVEPSSSSPPLDVDAIQLEARMALARRDYRALTLLGRRLQPPFKDKLEAAARAKNDAGVRDVLRELEQGPPPADDVDDAIRALLPDYLERRRSDAAEVADALANGRYDHVAFVGHRLAGTARAFGMEALSDVGSGLERAGAHRADDEIRTLLQRMHQLLAEASR